MTANMKRSLSKELFDRVQQQLNCQARRHSTGAAHRAVKAPLTGKLFDAAGEPMSPAFSRGRASVFTATMCPPRCSRAEHQIRSASSAFLRAPWTPWSKDWSDAGCRQHDRRSIFFRPFDCVKMDFRLDMPSELAATFRRAIRYGNSHSLIAAFMPRPSPGRASAPRRQAADRRRHQNVASRSRPDRRLAQGPRHGWQTSRVANCGNGSSVALRTRTAPAWLSSRPTCKRDILAGHQPPTLTLEKLRHIDIPLCWGEQRKVLGWS